MYDRNEECNDIHRNCMTINIEPMLHGDKCKQNFLLIYNYGYSIEYFS